MPLQKSSINKILVISLTNIGDVILTFPVIDVLRQELPSAEISIVVGPKAESLVVGNPLLERVYVFDKHQSPGKTLLWLMDLRKEHFDLVVDLRNTAIPFFIAPKKRTSFLMPRKTNQHMRDHHLERLRSVLSFAGPRPSAQAVFIPPEDHEYVIQMIAKEGEGQAGFVVMAPSAADPAKRWPQEKFAQLADLLIEKYCVKIVFVGDDKDRKVVQQIIKKMQHQAVNVCGRTNLVQLAAMLNQCLLAIVNDSAPMHLASYINVPIVAIFGPTDVKKYGPWSSESHVAQNNTYCGGCNNSIEGVHHTCMEAITVDDISQLLTIKDGKVVFCP